MFDIEKKFSFKIKGFKNQDPKRAYKFEQVDKAKEEILRLYSEKEILDFGIGEPDAMAHWKIRDALKKEVDVLENRVYPENGILDFKIAVSKHMKEIFNVSLDPEKEINHCIGIKSGLAYFPKILINNGDYLLMPRPSYPVIKTQVEWLGGNVYDLDLKKSLNFLPDLDSIPEFVLKAAKLIYINYPNNPTGATAPRSFYEELVHFAMENEIIVVQDAAYVHLSYKEKALSFLEIDGAKSVGVEFHSFSKTYNMTGWRIAFIAGNSHLIKAFSEVKSHMDSGQFIAIQKAAITAMENHLEIVPDTAKKYKKRLDNLAKILKAKGFEIAEVKSGFFLYAFIPKGIKKGRVFNTASDFSEFLIKEKLIVTVPWDELALEAAVRFSVTFSEEEEGITLSELEKRLKDLEFLF